MVSVLVGNQHNIRIPRVRWRFLVTLKEGVKKDRFSIVDLETGVTQIGYKQVNTSIDRECRRYKGLADHVQQGMKISPRLLYRC